MNNSTEPVDDGDCSELVWEAIDDNQEIFGIWNYADVFCSCDPYMGLTVTIDDI